QVVVKDEQIDVVNDVEIALPGDVIRLDDADALHVDLRSLTLALPQARLVPVMAAQATQFRLVIGLISASICRSLAAECRAGDGRVGRPTALLRFDAKTLEFEFRTPWHFSCVSDARRVFANRS